MYSAYSDKNVTLPLLGYAHFGEVLAGSQVLEYKTSHLSSIHSDVYTHFPSTHVVRQEIHERVPKRSYMDC